MPHGWAIAEVWLLMRNCLVFESDQQLVLLSGIPPAWFTSLPAETDAEFILPPGTREVHISFSR